MGSRHGCTEALEPLTDPAPANQSQELHFERYRQAYDALLEYCGRLMRAGKRIPPGILASYGLAVAHAENVREAGPAGSACKRFRPDRRNPDAYLCLARVYLLHGLPEKRAIDVLAQGLRLCGNASRPVGAPRNASSAFASPRRSCFCPASSDNQRAPGAGSPESAS